MRHSQRPRSVKETSLDYFERADVVAEYGSFDFLLAAEQALLDRVGSQLATWDVLDLGVGGGRTSGHVAARARTYHGVDLSEAMVRRCRQRFPDPTGRIRFSVGDACRLDGVADAAHDLVLFAFQGLDSIMAHDDRLAALAEVRRVLRPGGTFAFSSDNLLYERATLSWRRALRAGARTPGAAGRIREVRRSIGRTARLRRANAPLSRLEGGHATFTFVRPRYEASPDLYEEPDQVIAIDGYSIEPREQVAQLVSTGFEDVRILAMDGADVTADQDASLARWQWLYYVCRKPRA